MRLHRARTSATPPQNLLPRHRRCLPRSGCSCSTPGISPPEVYSEPATRSSRSLRQVPSGRLGWRRGRRENGEQPPDHGSRGAATSGRGAKVVGSQRSRQLEMRSGRAFGCAGGIEDRRRREGGARRSGRRACTEQPDMCKRAPPTSRFKRKPGGSLPKTVAPLWRRYESSRHSHGTGAVPGAKTVVFLSDGFLLQSMESELRAASVRRPVPARTSIPSTRGAQQGRECTIDRPECGRHAGGPARV
jgi:hypothetical protein